ncbi:MAG TPA: LysR substrate-binding domain-containing protein [Acidimicrobiales bacterium]|nr:LysR substrate-binding domain-containing protein [Acidimicrobiales bacterium]
MDLRQVANVVAVVDHGGFTKAAAAVPISQPALSQSVRALERELGIELFDRIGRGVRLTAAGEAFLGPARALLREAANARGAVASVAGGEAGHLDVVALPTLVVEPLVALVGAFRRAHPGVTVRITEPEDAAAVLELVRTGECELGLGEGAIERAGLEADVLFEQELLAVLPPGTAVPTRGRFPIARFAEMPLLTTPAGTSTRRLVDEALARAGTEATVAVETDHREAIVPLVLAGAGAALLAEPLARQAADQGASIARLDPPVRRLVSLVHRPGAVSPAAQAFRDLARAAHRR